MSRRDLSNEQWERLRPLLPPQKPRTGRPAKDHRTVLNGILWLLRTGAPWRDLPSQYGPWQTVASRFYRWRRSGREHRPKRVPSLSSGSYPAIPRRLSSSAPARRLLCRSAGSTWVLGNAEGRRCEGGRSYSAPWPPSGKPPKSVAVGLHRPRGADQRPGPPRQSISCTIPVREM